MAIEEYYTSYLVRMYVRALLVCLLVCLFATAFGTRELEEILGTAHPASPNMVCCVLWSKRTGRCLFICWEQKGAHFFFLLYTTAAAAIVVRASLFCHGKEDERVGATIGADARKAHAIGVPPDARKSNTLFLTGVLAVAKQRHEVHRVSATLTHEVIDDFFLSRRPDLSLPLFSLSPSSLSASFAAY